jgi:small subunit ribosomal protein S6e
MPHFSKLYAKNKVLGHLKIKDFKMPIKLNISDKGKAWKIEVPEEALSGKSVGDKFDGKDIKPELEGYELEITGGSDIAGFPLSKDVEGLGLRGVILKKGWGMRDSTEGLRVKKTVRGKVISGTTSQINIKVLKAGKKTLAEVFPEQANLKLQKMKRRKKILLSRKQKQSLKKRKRKGNKELW